MRSTRYFGALASIVILTAFSVLTFGCEADSPLARDIIPAFAKAGATLETAADENPALDAVTHGGVSTTALLMYSIASTLGLFVKNREARDLRKTVEEIDANPSTPPASQQVKSVRARRAVVKVTAN